MSADPLVKAALITALGTIIAATIVAGLFTLWRSPRIEWVEADGNDKTCPRACSVVAMRPVIASASGQSESYVCRAKTLYYTEVLAAGNNWKQDGYLKCGTVATDSNGMKDRYDCLCVSGSVTLP